jgi:hypothetical protein
VCLLAARERTDPYRELPWNDVKEIAKSLGVRTPMEYKFHTLDEILNSLHALNALDEGYVCRLDQDSGVWRVKVKNPRYLAIANLRNNGVLSDSRVACLVMAQDEDEYLSYFPEDQALFEPYLRARDEMYKMIKILTDSYMAYPSQKDFALAVKDTPVSSIMFALRKGQSVEDSVKKMSDDSKALMLQKLIKNRASS